MKTHDLSAVLIGATGLVGSRILQILLNDPRFSSVTVFARRSTNLQHSKLTEHIVDFKKMNQWKHLIRGDVAFSALGTTRGQAGSIDAQYEVDYTYQAEFAKACAQDGVGSFILISSMGANSRSKVPYTKMKGELEDFVETLGFRHIQILRPGPLVGEREKERLGEKLLVPVSQMLSKLPFLKDIHPVSGETVAKAAVESAFRDDALKVHNPTEVRLSFSHA